jgi:hypothetical protein
MLSGAESAVASATEAIDVSRLAGDPAAEANARINLVTARANEGTPPGAAEVGEIVELALRAGVTEEAYRAVVNFLWSAQPFLSVDALKRAFAELHARLEQVPPLELFGSYLDLSCASILHVPTGRWAVVEEVVEQNPSREAASGRIVRCELAAGLGVRRGDLRGAADDVAELVETALTTGEPQRIVPCACVAGPYAALTGDDLLLRRLTDAVLSMSGRIWVSAFTVAPLCRALFHAGAGDQLAALVVMLDALAADTEIRGHHRTSLATGRGLLALCEERPRDAAVELERAAGLERALGRTYFAACIELDLARAHELAGAGEDAARVEQGARSVLDAAGCVNPF